MKRSTLAFSFLLAAPLASYANNQLIPAGSLIQCTIEEPKISSKTTAIGDPVLCQVSHAERYGRSELPYDSFLVGRFEDYKDPGHLVGKGWMELKFQRMVIEPNTVIPVDARVVDVPGYQVDRQGRIIGKGHAVRDTVEWMIPVLWPIDLIELPRRGPRPTLKQETRLTLKIMDDMRVPESDGLDRDPSGLVRRPQADAAPPATNDAPTNAYAAPPQEEQPPTTAYAPPPPQEQQSQAPPMYQPSAMEPQQPEYAPPAMAYAPPPVYMPPPVYIVQSPMYVTPPPSYWYARPRVIMPPVWGPRSAVVYRGGYAYRVIVP
jgi:hypothetical protein